MAILFLIGKGEEEMNIIPELLTRFDGKPNYQMAPDYSLVLQSCEYEKNPFGANAENHKGLFQGIYENLREVLSRKYIEFLHFQSLGLGLLKVPIADQVKLEKNKKPLLLQKPGVTV